MKKGSTLPEGMSEYRLIFFRESEMMQAIGAFVRQQKQPPPVGMVTRIVFDEQEYSMTLHMALDSGSKVEHTFNKSEITEALIRYCKYVRIPLPRAGKKELRIVSNRPAFLIREPGSGLDYDDVPVDFRV
jgi:hypothetical protein